jgi:hypothetical protein
VQRQRNKCLIYTADTDLHLRYKQGGEHGAAFDLNVFWGIVMKALKVVLMCLGMAWMFQAAYAANWVDGEGQPVVDGQGQAVQADS